MLFNGVKLRSWIRIGTLVALVAGLPGLVSAQALRVCADPDNLPFSKSEGPERGMYVELAELVGKKLNSPVEYSWYLTFYQRRALRNTVQQDTCDAVFALPAEGEYKARGLVRTKPFIGVSYAIVADPSFAFGSLDDLKLKKLGVQFMTTPHVMLSTIGGFNSVTYKTAEETLDALAKGEVDAAFLWGPVAGYENKRRFASRWKITPVSGHNFDGHMAVAVKRGKDSLTADIDRALIELKPEIDALADKYGFPRSKPVDLSKLPASSGVAGGRSLADSRTVNLDWVRPVQSDTRKEPKSRQKAAKKEEPAAPAAPELSEQAKAGRVRFNDQCSHCHGTDGFSPVIERDLRRLTMRYGAKWQETATTTIKDGRVSQGMPTWKDILKEPDIQGILSFLSTIQK